jgi:phage terminase large subunit
VNAQFPEKLSFLFEPMRYKVAHGGRGGAKSWAFARALLIQGAQRPLRILCARETMKSIADSVHKLLSDQISSMELQAHYAIEKSRIIGNGTEFTFAGLAHNIDNIKSLESYDIVWVEEAANVSRNSWEKLIPTMRKEGSEIWVSFNPELDTDDTYRRFVLSPPPRSKVVRVSWRDNPWFPEELRHEMEYLRETDPDAYEHVWEGGTRSSVEGAVYKAELLAAEKSGRITRVPYDASRSVDTFWDLGYGDMVSIWFAQAIGFEYRVLDYHQDSKRALDWYLQVLQGKGYTYGTCVLPWDGGAKSLGTGRSIEEQMRAKGFRTRVLPQWRVADGINAVRTIFPQLYFDAEKCADGLSGLRRYQWGPPPANGGQKREPLHNEASHPADALRALAVYLKAPAPEKEKQRVPPRTFNQHNYSPFG